MTVVETKLKHWNQKLNYQKHKYPQCQCGTCPNFFWNALFIGSRGQGKTYSCSLLIKHYEKNIILDEEENQKEIRTFLISPTIEANEVFTSLRSLDMENDSYSEYTDETLENIIKDIKQTKKESEDCMLYIQAFKKYSKLKDEEIYKLDNEDLHILAAKDFQHPSELEKIRFEFPPINIIILDDLLGSSCMSNKKNNYFQKQFIQNRHNQICYCVLVQAVKSIPKPIHLNSSVYWIGKFANVQKVVEDVYEEVSDVPEQDFIDMYLHAVSKPYGALIIDMTGKNKQFRLDWDTQLSIKDLKQPV
jgi:hypothetical protein